MSDEKSILGEICSLFYEEAGLPCPVMPAEVTEPFGDVAMWVMAKGGVFSTKYADGGEILEVPFELKLRHRDIDPSDRFSAMDILERAVSFLRKTGRVRDVKLPASPCDTCSSTAVYTVSMKYVREAEASSSAYDRELRVILRSGDRELYFSRYSPMRILSDGLCGFDFPEVQVKLMQDAAGNISYSEKRMLCHRDMSILFEVTDDEMYSEVRDRVIGMMDPVTAVTVTGYYMGRHRTVEAYPSKAPEFYPDKRQIRLYMAAPQPYFAEGSKVKSSAPLVQSMISFPATIVKNAGITCSLAGDRTKVKVNNPGDTSCPVTICLRAFGDVTCPYVILDGKKIKYLGEMQAGDVLRIRTGDGEREIMINNIISYAFDRASRFFSLAPGENEIMIYADSGNRNLMATFELEPRYLGI